MTTKEYISLYSNDLNRLLLLWDDIGLQVRPSLALYNSCLNRYFETLESLDIATPRLFEMYKNRKYNWSNLTQLIDAIITHPNYDKH